MKVAREGVVFICIAWALALGALALGVTRHSVAWYIAAAPLVIVAICRSRRTSPGPPRGSRSS
jgi:hypothetical protein